MGKLSHKQLKKIIKKSVAFIMAAGLSMAAAKITGIYGENSFVQVQAAEYDSMLGECIADFDLSDYYELTPPEYNTYYPWECVWYACARAEEKAGHRIPEIRGLGNAAEWYDRSELEKGTDIRSNSILCYGKKAGNKYGHVVYIECVKDDTVYYTEANVDGGKSDELRSPSDGVLKKTTVDTLEAPENFQGYIYLDRFIDGELMLGDDNLWHFYKDGNINTAYTGMARNEYGWWYITDGELDLSYTGLAENDYGYWYFNDGFIAFDYTGMVNIDDEWYYCQNGYVNKEYTGMACDGYKWWYFNNGELDTEYTGMALNEYGWWYFNDGELDTEYTGMALNEYGWWYFDNGVLDLRYTGMALNEYGWWYFNDGILDLKYTGVGENEYGLWYYRKGIIRYDYNGSAVYNDKEYTFTNGHADF